MTNEGTLWDYNGKTGPKYWAQLNDEFAQAACYPYQAPIALDHKESSSYQSTLRFHYQKAEFEEVIQFPTTHLVPQDSRNYIVFQEEKYWLTDIHFHKPSEHVIDEQREKVEFHFVHKSRSGKIAVLAVLFELTSLRSTIFNGQTKTSWDFKSKSHKLDPIAFMPVQKTHFHYTGSLTTPPTTGPVQWFVFDRLSQMDKDFFAQFVLQVTENARPLQDKKDRSVYFGTVNKTLK